MLGESATSIFLLVYFQRREWRQKPLGFCRVTLRGTSLTRSKHEALLKYADLWYNIVIKEQKKKKMTNELEINNDQQTIQGVLIANTSDFLSLRAILQAEHLEGFNPTKEDIEEIIKKSKQKDKDFDRLYQKLFRKSGE